MEYVSEAVFKEEQKQVNDDKEKLIGTFMKSYGWSRERAKQFVTNALNTFALQVSK